MAAWQKYLSTNGTFRNPSHVESPRFQDFMSRRVYDKEVDVDSALQVAHLSTLNCMHRITNRQDIRAPAVAPGVSSLLLFFVPCLPPVRPRRSAVAAWPSVLLVGVRPLEAVHRSLELASRPR